MKKEAFYLSNHLNHKKISYGFFKKKFRFSKDSFHSLNCNLNSEGNNNLINKNIGIAANNIGFNSKKIKFIKQIHSSKVFFIDNNNFATNIEGDGMITTKRNIVLAILTADCAPIFIFDDKGTFICSLHSGWKGCLKNIIKEAVCNIESKSLNKSKLFAVVGPCLAKNNFEVDIKFIDSFINNDQFYDNYFSKNTSNQKFLFDMRGLINHQLKNCSIENISNIDKDTYTSDLFFSHRFSSHTENLPTGRMINLIGFKDY